MPTPTERLVNVQWVDGVRVYTEEGFDRRLKDTETLPLHDELLGGPGDSSQRLDLLRLQIRELIHLTPLAPKERAVAHGLMDGYTQVEMAAKLCVNLRTVSALVKKVRAKLNAAREQNDIIPANPFYGWQETYNDSLRRSSER